MPKSLNNNSSTLILFDIDYTLFDVNKFRRKIFKIIKNMALGKEIKNIDSMLREAYIVSRKDTGYFSLRTFLEYILTGLKVQVPIETLEKEILKEDLFTGNLYKEAKNVLRTLAKNKSLRIGIFSAGDFFQRKKVKEIEDFLNREHVHIFVKKHKELPAIIKLYKKYKLYIVDDMLKILRTAKLLNKNVFTIWVKRKKFARQAEEITDFMPDAIVANLKEIPKLVTISIKLQLD